MKDKNAANREVNDKILVSLRKIIQALDLNSRQLVKQVGLTGPQLVILQYIFTAEEASVGQVAKNVSLSQGTVTGILERMEKRGIVSRKRGHFDKRQVMVTITETGKTLLRKALPVMQETFLGKINTLEDWEKTMILSALQRIEAMLEAKAVSEEPFNHASNKK
jgi:DNA-binding MarR family transcriptional regulator